MYKKIFSTWLMITALMACDENAEILQLKDSIDPNEIADLSAESFVLDREKAGEVFQEFHWSEPDFGFPAAVTYTLEADLPDNNFSAPVSILTSNEPSGEITVNEMNKKLLALGLDPDEASPIELRVRSSVGANVPHVFSTTRVITVTPYATDFPPIYMIGDATGGWDLGKAVEMRSIAPNKYETTAEFTNGGKFRFFTSPSWDAEQFNWGTFDGGSVDANLQNGADGDGNFLFSGATGWYTITTDLKNATIVMEPTERPALYMIGAAIKGWDLGQAVEMTRLKDGVFQVTTSFTSGETFRFFTKPDWSAGTINYPYFDGGTVDPLFENANDGDSNLKFVGTSGEYTITVDLYNLIVDMEIPGAAEPIYMIGDATGGWDLGLAAELPKTGLNKYEGIATFTNGGKFRFFKTPDWGAQQYNWSYFTGSVDSNLQDSGDGDGNIVFAGTTGSWKITVDLQAKSIVMQMQ